MLLKSPQPFSQQRALHLSHPTVALYIATQQVALENLAAIFTATTGSAFEQKKARLCKWPLTCMLLKTLRPFSQQQRALHLSYTRVALHTATEQIAFEKLAAIFTATTGSAFELRRHGTGNRYTRACS